MPVPKPYAWLARYYDVMFEAGRKPIDDARHQIAGEILTELERSGGAACELACGPGTTAVGMAKRGIRTFAVDLSPTMCRLAREKARRARTPVRVVRGDMRTFRLPERVDLVTCEADALNHVPGKADLARVARAVARALKPGGHFYFDVNLRAGFARYWTGIWWKEAPGVVMAMRSGNDAAQDRAWADVEWFVREGRMWRRHRERVEEVCWSAEELDEALAAAGFGQVRTWDAEPFFRGDGFMGPGCRLVYLARKGGA